MDTTTNSMQLFSHDLLNTKNLLAQRGATKTSSFPAKYFHAMFFWTPCAVWKPTCKSIQAASRLVRHCALPTITMHPSHCAVQNAKTENIQKKIQQLLCTSDNVTFKIQKFSGLQKKDTVERRGYVPNGFERRTLFRRGTTLERFRCQQLTPTDILLC